MAPDRPPKPYFGRDPYFRARAIGKGAAGIWDGLNRAYTWLAGCRPAFLDNRYFRLGVSYFAWGSALAGTVTVTSGMALEKDDDHLRNMCFANCALAMTYLLMHPGTKGNSQVAVKEQKGLLEATYGFMWDKEMWMRVGLCGFASFLASHNSTPKHQYDSMLKFYATGLNLLPFLTFRAGPTARLYLGDSAQKSAVARRLELIKAALANLVTTCINSSSSTLFTINATILAKIYDDTFSTKTDPTGPTMSATVAGIFAHQVVVYFTVHVLSGGSKPGQQGWWSAHPLAQLMGLMARAGIRVRVLDHFVPMDPLKKNYVMIFEIADLASRFLVARKGNARDIYEGGLMMKKPHAEALREAQRQALKSKNAAAEAKRQAWQMPGPRMLDAMAMNMGLAGSITKPYSHDDEGMNLREFKLGRLLPPAPPATSVHRRENRAEEIRIDMKHMPGGQPFTLNAAEFVQITDDIPESASNVLDVAISQTMSFMSRPVVFIRSTQNPVSVSSSAGGADDSPPFSGSRSPTPSSEDIENPGTVNVWSPSQSDKKTK